MTGRRARSLPDLRQCSDEVFAAASAELTRIACEKLDRLDIPDPFWQVERDLLLGTGEHEGVLAQFLACERARTTDFSPRYFEVAFGPAMTAATSPSDPELSADEPITVGDVRLRGRIDRIETGEGGFTIIDYKTGTAPVRMQDVRTGLSLQLPLYLRAVQQLLRDRLGIDARPAAGMHYRLAPAAKLEIVLGNERFRGTAFDADSRSRQLSPDDDAFDAAIDRSVAMAGQSVQAIAEGRFPLASPENVPEVCRNCTYSTICRIQLTQRIEPDRGENG